MGNFDDYDDNLVLMDFIDDSVDSLSNPIPLLRRKLYTTLPARIITQDLDSFQNSPHILFRDAP